jgi:hypothetical protein
LNAAVQDEGYNGNFTAIKRKQKIYRNREEIRYISLRWGLPLRNEKADLTELLHLDSRFLRPRVTLVDPVTGGLVEVAVPFEEVAMERDMDLVRKILFAIEAKRDLKEREISVDGYAPDVAGAHVELLYEQGYIRGSIHRSSGKAYATVLVKDLSWNGHEFIASVRPDDRWSLIKAKFSAADWMTVPLKVVEGVAMEVTKEWVLRQLGFKP